MLLQTINPAEMMDIVVNLIIHIRELILNKSLCISFFRNNLFYDIRVGRTKGETVFTKIFGHADKD